VAAGCSSAVLHPASMWCVNGDATEDVGVFDVSNAYSRLNLRGGVEES